MNTSFGQDPLEGRLDLSRIRKEAFELRFKIEVIFSGLVNETVTPFETEILFFIRETKRHINDSQKIFFLKINYFSEFRRINVTTESLLNGGELPF